MANIVLDFLHNYQTGERRETEPANAYQYDEGHVLEAVLPEVITSAEIHYWIRGMEEADTYTPTSITPNADNSCTVLGNIPNSYFETNGELRIYIVVTDGTASITTYEGKLHICQRSQPDDYVDDDPDNEAVRVIAAARGYAETSEAWAVGQINGEDVPSTADQYQNNASYYAGQAASAASSAAAQASLAPAYDNTATYAVGDYCLHDGQLYECTTAIATAEAWTAAHWTAVTVGGELSTLKDEINDNIEPRLYRIDGGKALTWEIGNVGITTSGWDYNATASTKRIRTPKGGEIYLPANTKIGLSSYTNARYYVGIRKNDGTYYVNNNASTAWQTADITLPYGGYCIFMISNNPEATVTDISALSDLLTIEKPASEKSFIQLAEEYFESIEKEIPSVTFSNEYISDIGIVTSHNGYRTSDLFELKSGETFYLKAKGEAAVSAIYRYSKDGLKRIDGIAKFSQQGYDEFYYTASEKVEYIRFCYLYSAMVDYCIYRISKSSPIALTNRNTTCNDYYKLMFDKVLCVGDSLTVGWYNDVYGAVAGKNYPAFLSQMTGWECTNAGHSGYTTKQYWEGNFLPTYDLTTYDAVIIFLGTNGGFTDTLDDDTAYTPYADTNTGDYCKIIEYIEGQNANIKIFMVIPPLFNETQNYGNAKEVLKEIAEKYTLPIIDLTSHNNHFIANRNNGILHPNNDNVHYGKVGYMQIADNIRSAIMDIIADNPLAYEYPY